ncbi:hypothetical protein L9F63_017162, partial [Diploptera punctata]
DISLPLRDVNNYVIVMGSSDVRKGMESRHVQIRYPTKFIPHKEFNHEYMSNDIGLIKLGKAFDVNKYVKPLFVPTMVVNLKTDYMCTEYVDEDSYATCLQEVDVPVIDSSTCQHYYSSDTIHENMNLCAGYVLGQKDACSGDSGSPLVCGGRLTAITSWGYRCAYPESPGVYTKVDYYAKWIENVTKTAADIPKTSNTDVLTHVLANNVTEVPRYLHHKCTDHENKFLDNSESGRRVVGGSPAAITDYPFATSLQTKYRVHKCGGTLINIYMVLTAAHCLVVTANVYLPLRDVKKYVLVMGSSDVRKGRESQHVQIRSPIKFIPHKDFNHEYMSNDIGLIE